MSDSIPVSFARISIVGWTQHRSESESGFCCRRGVDKTAGGHKFFELLAFCLPGNINWSSRRQSGQSYRQKIKNVPRGDTSSVSSCNITFIFVFSHCNPFLLSLSLFFHTGNVSCKIGIIVGGYFRRGNDMTTSTKEEWALESQSHHHNKLFLCRVHLTNLVVFSNFRSLQFIKNI